MSRTRKARNRASQGKITPQARAKLAEKKASKRQMSTQQVAEARDALDSQFRALKTAKAEQPQIPRPVPEQTIYELTSALNGL